MEKLDHSLTALDKDLKDAAEQFARFVSEQSVIEALRKSLLESAVFQITKALESNFEGHQKTLATALRIQADLIDDSY